MKFDPRFWVYSLGLGRLAEPHGSKSTSENGPNLILKKAVVCQALKVQASPLIP